MLPFLVLRLRSVCRVLFVTANVVFAERGAAADRAGHKAGDAADRTELLLEGERVRGGGQRGGVAAPLHDGQGDGEEEETPT